MLREDEKIACLHEMLAVHHAYQERRLKDQPTSLTCGLLLALLVLTIAAALYLRTGLPLLIPVGGGLAYWAFSVLRQRWRCPVHRIPLTTTLAWYRENEPGLMIKLDINMCRLRDRLCPRRVPSNARGGYSLEPEEGATKRRIRYCTRCEAISQLHGSYFRSVTWPSPYPEDQGPALTDLLTEHLVGPEKPFVVFAHLTVVTFDEAVADPEAEAIALLQAWEPSLAALPVDDFQATELSNECGWLVRGTPPKVQVFINQKRTYPQPQTPADVALLGRLRLAQDAYNCQVVFVRRMV